MTYKELLEELTSLTDEQLEMTVTIQDDDREYREALLYVTVEDDVIEKDHPFLGTP